LTAVAAVCAFCAWAALSGCATVPYTGRRSLVLISEKEERKMGEQAYRKTLAESKLSTDAERLAILKRVGNRLAAAADRPDYQWEFNLIENDKVVNAWCMPGGKIAFYTGIWPVAQDETGIAVVMGHEIAHALARHGAERMSRAMIVQFGGEVLSVLTGTQSAAARELYAQAYGLGTQLGVMLPHSRENEAEADEIGLVLMAKAGYDPRAALAFWKRMETAAGGKKKDDPLSRFTSTHPSDRQRQKNIERLLPKALQYYKRQGSAE